MAELAARFGAAVKAARKEKGWAAAFLARHIGVSAGTLSKIESGKLWPREQIVEALQSNLGVSWATLFWLPKDESDLGLTPISARTVDVIQKLETKSLALQRKVRELRLELERAHGQIEALEKQAQDARQQWLESNRVAVAFAGIYHIFRAELAPEALARVKAVYLQLTNAPVVAASRLRDKPADGDQE